MAHLLKSKMFEYVIIVIINICTCKILTAISKNQRLIIIRVKVQRTVIGSGIHMHD